MNGFGRKNKEIQTNCQGFHVHLHAGGSGDFGAGVSGRGAGGDGEIKRKNSKVFEDKYSFLIFVSHFEAVYTLNCGAEP